MGDVRAPLIGRLALSLSLTAAVVSAPILPREHVHLAGIEGRTHVLVHSHADGLVASSSSAPTLVDSHGDHGRAVFITSMSDRTVRLSADHLVLPAAVSLVPAVTARSARWFDVADSSHGPPGRIWLSRGPPALLS
jgi:hypothetical protein